MGFETFNLASVKLDKPEPVPAGTYVFEIAPGTQYRTNEKKGNIQELNVRFIVVGGELSGKGVFFAYPDPSSLNGKGKVNTWSAQALKKLEISIGQDIQEGEDSAAYLNRVAGSRITATVAPGNEYTDNTTGEKKNYSPNFSPFSVAPAA